jgi:hypothetical protein
VLTLAVGSRWHNANPAKEKIIVPPTNTLQMFICLPHLANVFEIVFSPSVFIVNEQELERKLLA